MSSEQPAVEAAADFLAQTVAAQIEHDMLVGLGTGRTARRGIRALAARVKNEGLSITCVATSEASEKLATQLGLKLTDLAMVEEIDFLFDGADEVDHQLRMLKGSGGAMTRERIVAYAARRRAYMVAAEKLTDRLGTRATLPIALLAFGLASTRAHIRDIGLNGVLRRNMDGQLFLTDNGNLILDVSLDERNLEELADQLDLVPGVIDHGLFLYEAQEVFVEQPDGVKRLIREGEFGA